MFINVIYRDTPELSSVRRGSSETDPGIEKTLLVNPDCLVRVMLEYIRKKCRLGIFTQFDLCDERGGTMGLFHLPTFAYTTELFEHKRTYYIVVFKTERDRAMSIIPQLNRENFLYHELKVRVKRFLTTGEVSPLAPTPQVVTTPLPSTKTRKK